MSDHVKFGVSNYAASRALFLKALEPLGVAVASEGPPTYGVIILLPCFQDLEGMFHFMEQSDRLAVCDCSGYRCRRALFRSPRRP